MVVKLQLEAIHNQRNVGIRRKIRLQWDVSLDWPPTSTRLPCAVLAMLRVGVGIRLRVGRGMRLTMGACHVSPCVATHRQRSGFAKASKRLRASNHARIRKQVQTRWCPRIDPFAFSVLDTHRTTVQKHLIMDRFLPPAFLKLVKASEALNRPAKPPSQRALATCSYSLYAKF